jgi:hypothetical protein
MNSLVAAFPDRKLHVILDNLNTHKKNERWLKKHPTVRFHFTPMSGASIYSCWARLRLGDRTTSFAELRQYLTNHKTLGSKLGLPFIQGKIAEIESEKEDAEVALVHIDQALAFANDTGEHQHGASLHSIRGKILLKLDPVKTEIAEVSFRAAIANAQQQGNRTSQLLPALMLGKLYQATNRAADARDVLAPALEGFKPTPELPEIAQAQALLNKLGPGIFGAMATSASGGSARCRGIVLAY